MNSCLDIDECVAWKPCLNGGTCFNLDPYKGGYKCECHTGYTGIDCEIHEEAVTLQTSNDFIAAIIVCLLVFLSKYHPYV